MIKHSPVIILSAALSVALLAGCGANANNDSADDAATGEREETTVNGAAVGEPVVLEDGTIVVKADGGYYSITQPNGDAATKEADGSFNYTLIEQNVTVAYMAEGDDYIVTRDGEAEVGSGLDALNEYLTGEGLPTIDEYDAIAQSADSAGQSTESTEQSAE